MQQFGTTFINYHLMPLIEEILTDAATARTDLNSEHRYLRDLFVFGYFQNPNAKQLFTDHYFTRRQENGIIPFASNSKSDQENRDALLAGMINYIRMRGENPEQRYSHFLPKIEKSDSAITQTIWPAEIKRNLFLMAYSIAQNFEQKQISAQLEQKTRTEGESDELTHDRELLDKGVLVLVKDGENWVYKPLFDLPNEQPSILMVPPPAPELAKFMATGETGNREFLSPATYSNQPLPVAADDSQLQTWTGDKVAESSRRQGVQLINNLMEHGFVINDQIQIDSNGNAFVHAQSAGIKLTVSVNVREPWAADSQYHFTFNSGEHVGKGFDVSASQLDANFGSSGEIPKTADQIYSNLQSVHDTRIPRAIGAVRRPNSKESSVGKKNPLNSALNQLNQNNDLSNAKLELSEEIEIPEPAMKINRWNNNTPQPFSGFHPLNKVAKSISNIQASKRAVMRSISPETPQLKANAITPRAKTQKPAGAVPQLRQPAQPDQKQKKQKSNIARVGQIYAAAFGTVFGGAAAANSSPAIQNFTASTIRLIGDAATQVHHFLHLT